MRKRTARAALPARTRGGLVLAVLLWAAGTAHLFASDVPGPQEGGAGPKDRVVVRVNGDPILASDLARAVARRVPSLTGHGALSKERLAFHEKAALQELVVRRLVLQEAARQGVTVPDAAVAAEEARLRARFPDPAAYDKALAGQGLDPDRVRDGLKEHLVGAEMERRVMAQVEEPTVAQLKAYFTEHPEQFRIPPQAVITYILAPVDASASQEGWGAAKAALEPLRERMVKGEPFAAVRADAEKAPDLRVVDLGRVHQGQADLAEIDKAAFGLEPGRISEPVWTLYGYALVYVSERKPARDLAFDELNRDLFKAEWLRARREEVLKDWVSGLMRNAKLEFGE